MAYVPNSSANDRIAFVDVHYGDPARAACVVAAHWTDSASIVERTVVIDEVSPYTQGRFYERELPCLIAVLGAIGDCFEVIVVDGYVELDDVGTPGLGAHLHAYYQGRFPVVGVAKTAYRGGSFAVPVTRGTSQRPLYVTARGLPAAEAAARVTAMHGAHRIPTLLRRVDKVSRGT